MDVTSALADVTGGVEVVVFCQPRAARSALVGMHGGALKVKVTAAPVDGRANQALLSLLAATLRVPQSRLQLLSGEGSRRKRIRVEGLDRATVASALEAGLGRPAAPNGRS
jgi:uncharacterized protein (TIGR00251 family)